jgi:ABC-type sugar transport system ATPase subunit
LCTDVKWGVVCVLQVGMVFQSYALFNHLSVADNIKFGLQVRRVTRGDPWMCPVVPPTSPAIFPYTSDAMAALGHFQAASCLLYMLLQYMIVLLLSHMLRCLRMDISCLDPLFLLSNVCHCILYIKRIR